MYKKKVTHMSKFLKLYEELNQPSLMPVILECEHYNWTWCKDVPICNDCHVSFGDWSDERVDKWLRDLCHSHFETKQPKNTPKTESIVKPQQIELFSVPSVQRSYSYE
jgi:hypothetical protein